MATWTDSFLKRASRAGLEFEASFYGAAVQRNPHNVQALAELGHALTRLERFEEGLEVDRQLVRLAPENETAHYNLACSLALCGRVELALDSLDAAVYLGYDDLAHLLADDDLQALHQEPRFRALVEQLS